MLSAPLISAVGAGSGIGSLLSAGMLSNRKNPTNPATGAMNYLDQIPNELRQYLMPYINQGQKSMGKLNDTYGNLTDLFPDIKNRIGGMNNFTGDLSKQFQNLANDPTGMMNKIGAGYKESPGFAFQRDQGLRAAQNAAAAGGYMGSPQHQQQSMELAENFANKDYGDYLNRGMGQFGMGLQGLQGQQGAMNDQLQNLLRLFGQGTSGMEHLSDMGYGASNNLSSQLANLLGSKANLAYAGQANQNQMQQGNEGAMAGLFGSGIGSLLMSLLSRGAT
ncbi:MAG: hypothetical protein ACYC6W_11055 [Nitrosotalea sp.]